MQVRFLLGPAGSGKTFQCLSEIRQALARGPEGLPLLLVAPKQSTYQLERELLESPSLQGFTRLRVLSLERLARFVFGTLGKPMPSMLDEEGRIMVLRALLTRKRADLKLFRASARLTGFAAQLSSALSELQREQLTPGLLRGLADKLDRNQALAFKLQDLALLFESYLTWLADHELLDADSLVSSATVALARNQQADSTGPIPHESVCSVPIIEHLWVDGFAEWAPRELGLLAAVAPLCLNLTITFCLEEIPGARESWLSVWTLARDAFDASKRRFSSLPDVEVRVLKLSRNTGEGRFSRSPALSHLERHWALPEPWPGPLTDSHSTALPVRVAQCADAESEVRFAAREIKRHIRSGGRYRDVAIFVRNLEDYHEPLQAVFGRYEIPFFLDRREPIAHHPLTELIRSALRIAALGWRHDDVFAALKTGLIHGHEGEIDRMENEALARGWQGNVWETSPDLPDDPELARWLADFKERLLGPLKAFQRRLETLLRRPTGAQLASALRDLFVLLDVETTLTTWTAVQPVHSALNSLSTVHTTVWDQANLWLDNVELAFPDDDLSLREWVAIVDAGLANLTVGVIPPALDQVIVGPVDRSSPDVKIAYVLGLNETVFPAPPPAPALLTEADRIVLEQLQVKVAATTRRHLARERFLAYVACSRPREQLILTCSLQDGDGAQLNPSPFIHHLQQLFPGLQLERISPEPDWLDAEHHSELVVPLMKLQQTIHHSWTDIVTLPALASLCDGLRDFRPPGKNESLSPWLAERLYHRTLQSSVSRLEQFAACPFRFFINSGLRAEERQAFQFGSREQGSFQHDVLALFHQEIQKESKRWRDLNPDQARRRVAALAEALALNFNGGLLQATEQTRFMAGILSGSLQKFVGTVVEWMHSQYQFDPVAVEVPFGETPEAPAWVLDLGGGRRLALRGRIDRVDFCQDHQNGQAYCVVVDYKSSQKQIEDVLVENGLQLQLLTYLNVLRYWPNPLESFGVSRVVPAGVFYVNLRGNYERADNRGEALSDTDDARKLAYRHSGRFNLAILPFLDARPECTEGDQFNYRRKKDGQIHGACREPVSGTQFQALLDSAEANLRAIGLQIFAGNIDVAPYRKGNLTACDQCDYRTVCRIDPWLHSFRNLRSASRGACPDAP